ncbi:alpha-mannosidase 2x-like [Mytilus galloprovincialis]|uniref:alpha-mannosidase 2x-like n=1 Tax=Mytilus galloprovincialis TaxID=29158 RepID=UPI003F7B6281
MEQIRISKVIRKKRKMKKYMVVWGSMFFIVVIMSLYLMMETVSNNMGRVTSDDVLNAEKLSKLENDLTKNEKIIKEIKDTVKFVSQGDKESLKKLNDIVRDADSKLNQAKEAVKELFQKPAEKIQAEQPIARIPVHNVAVSGSNQVCTLADAPNIKTDVQMLKLVDLMTFENPDGGVWKQGWNVNYDKNKYDKKKLYVFVVPHSHCDPGWVKTLDTYFNDQVKGILDNMVAKLEAYPKMKFMYAEVSFFSMWWSQIDQNKKNRVKKLIEKGQFEIITGGWVMNDEANTHYFAMIDQMIEGNQWLNLTLGVRPESGWAIDPFGHTPTMAYLLKKMNFKNMLIQRVHYAVKKALAKEKQLEFMWRQNWDQEGSTDILCHMMPFYSYDVPHTCGPDPKVCCQFDFGRLSPSRWNCPWRVPPVHIHEGNVQERSLTLLDQYRKKAELYRSNVLFIPVGDDFRYDRGDEWDKQYTNYQKIFDYVNSKSDLNTQIQFGTLTDYFKKLYEVNDVAYGQKPPSYPVLSGDFFTYADRDDHYWSGYYTSRPFYKRLDRVLEYHQRSAEIAFTMATAYSRSDAYSNFPESALMKMLVTARRALGLFQHHDGITGTAKDFVVIDYGKRMLEALMNAKRIIVESMTYLTAKSKSDYKYSNDKPIFNLDESRENHDSLAEKSVIDVTEEGSPVIFFNSLAHNREQVVTVHVNTQNVQVVDGNGAEVPSQTDAFWVIKNRMAPEEFLVSFVVDVPALGSATYLLKRTTKGSKSYGKVTMYNTEAENVPEQSPFTIKTEQEKDFSVENSFLKADFSGNTGFLKSVTTKDDGKQHKIEVSFVSYGISHGKEKSGAYLFLPDGPAKPINYMSPTIRITRGPIVSEVVVYHQYTEHHVRILSSPGTDGSAIDIYNLVDISSTGGNIETAMRINTDIQNTDREFFVDLNGFQMIKHKKLDKIPLQANFYPMPSMAFIEDDSYRFSVLSGQSLGMASLEVGQIEIMMDRRLNQDDNRGLGQPVHDNKVTPNRFALLFEKRLKPRPKEKITGFPSLQAHLTSLQLIQPIFVIPKNSDTESIPLLPNFKPMQKTLPCEIHLLNFRSLRYSEDDTSHGFKPRKDVAMLLHHLGFDCNFPNRGLKCDSSDGQISFLRLFKELTFKNTKETSLSLNYDQRDVKNGETMSLKPMEIYAYRTELQWMASTY